MLQNYLKIALRNLLKNKTFSFINIAGLAVGLASTMLLALWVLDEYSFENFQEKKDVLFQGKRNFKESETSIWTSTSQSGNTAEYIRKNFPEVKNAILTDWGNDVTINYGEKSLKKKWSSVEKPFFDMFTFPFVKGSAKTAFTDINSVVLTEGMAKALFGDEDPMNKLVKINLKHTLKVTGILKDLPTNTRFKFDYLTSIKFLDSIDKTYYGWTSNMFQLWVELRPDANLEAVNKKMIEVYKTNNNNGLSNGDLFLYPLTRLRLYGMFKNGVESGEGLISLVSLFSIISFVILIIACINFMNLSTARSEKRAKEVGVRKVTGATRSSLIGLFLSESLLITILAFSMAILMVTLLLPAFNDLIEKQLAIPFENIKYIIGAVGLVLFTGFVSGSYPAFFLSSFQPIKVLKGTMQMGRGASLPRKILVIVQFCFSIILVIFTILVYQQIRFGQNQPLGYDQKNLMYFEMPGEMYKQFTPMKQDFLASGMVISAYSTNQPMNSRGNNSWGYEWRGQKIEQKNQLFDVVRVTFDFLKTTGVKLKEGRDYSPQFMADTIHSVLVNEAAIKVIGFKNPVGEIIRQGNETYTIVGVLKDFVFGNPFEDELPMMVQLMPNANGAANVVLRLNPQKSATECLEKISAIFKKYETIAPFDYTFVDTEFEKKFSKERLLSILAYLFGGLAIFVSCLGLFGLASFMAERRTKEIGIRKVLGASVSGIVMMLSKDFLKLVGIATIIAFPLAWLLGNRFLENYPKHINFAWWIFAISGIMAIVIALLTVSYQAIKAAVANPVKSLRTE